MRLTRLGVMVVSVGLLAACPGARGGGGAEGSATFRVFYPDQPADGFRAKLGKRFFVKPVAQCVYDNGRDARWSMTGARLESGELPPGFTIEEGAISGIAKAPGTWPIKVTFSGVTCAGKPRESITVDVIIAAR
ncbi:MAG: hypothetical protein H0T89_23515 [Deltaproteobacteria bacterium]|nr:hypothetical protein [Deltaproteobacteria bacterium]MDQ3298607.1 hypothetical protein [Myxococcota bacterium]